MLKPKLANTDSNDSGAFAPIEDILDALRDGQMVIMVDDEDRENEGDLVMLASHVRAEDINYMARYGRGLICLTLTRERCQRLRLPLMVSGTDSAHSTNFTVSIEAAEGITTGISAHDRARTVQVAVAADAVAEDLVQPGHIFPVMAQPGGVLTRAGHTEAGCDLARLAGESEPAAVIVEILNEDGSMARRPDLESFAAEHKLLIGTIADLIRYRLEKEVAVERIQTTDVRTAEGAFTMHAYEDYVNRDVHLALVHGDITTVDAPLVRVHVADTLGDVIGIDDPRLGWPLRDAMRKIVEAGAGVVVLLRYSEGPRELVDMIQALDQSAPQVEEGGGDADRELRQYGVGAQILRDLGVTRMRVLSAPVHMHAISGFGLEVVDYIND
ncbi:MAG: bifunctional 3,4-dihydroxy-2-butanone-4-phosphate synthase/GTP cyclohydrolase II [Pseudomonadota bacterium]